MLVTLEARIGQYQTDLAAANAATNRQLGAIEARFSKWSSGIKAQASSTALGIGAVFGSIGAYLGTEQVVEYANAYTRVTRALSAGKQIFGVALKSQSELTDLSNEARIDVEAFTKTYIRTEAAIRDYGFAAGTAATVTSTLAKALKLGSASSSEQASTILQFSQALQKGKLDGDEFRTVMENAGVVQELLAKRVGVTKGEIIKLAADGKLGVKDLVGALVDGGDQVDRVFRQLPTTVDEAFTVLRNNTITYVGKLNQATGATDGLVNVTAILAKNIETVGDAALVVAASLLAAFTPAIATNAALFATAIAAAAGPLGIVVALFVGGGTAIALFGDQIKLTADKTVNLIDQIKALAAAMTSLPDDPRLGFRGGARSDRRQPTARDPNRIDPTSASDQALARTFREGTTVEFGDGVLRKGNDPGLTGNTNAKRSAYERETAEVIKRTNALMAQAATVGESTLKTEKAKVARDLLTAAEETAKKTGIAITAKQLADIDRAAEKYAGVAASVEYLNVIQNKKEGIDALRDELSTLGLYGIELDKAKTRIELLNAAKKAGVPANLAEIDRIIDAETGLRADLSAMEDLKATSADALKGFISDLQQGKSATEALANALENLGSKFLDAGIDNLVTSLVGGAGKPGGGIASLFGFSNGGVMVPGQGPRSLRRFANGGVSNQAAIFGEAGPEAAIPLPDGRSVPVTLRMPNIPKAAAASSPSQIITVAPVFNVANGTAEGISQLKTEITPMIVKTVNEMFDRSARFSRTKI